MPINNGPMHVVAKAGAARAHDCGSRPARPPATAPRIDVIAGAHRRSQRNADGIALGGHPHAAGRRAGRDAVGRARPEPVDDLPPARLDEAAFSAERLAELYPSRADYQQRYAASVDIVIGQGFVLADDRDRLLDYGDPDAVGS